MHTPSLVSLIVCMDDAGGIGKAGTLPWKVPQDMRHFRETTSHHTVIMGGNTYRSIGNPLPNRTNIVVSRRLSPVNHPGVIITNELRHAVSLASHAPERTAFVIGGAQIYEQALGAGIVQEMIVTRLREQYGCDTFFPAVNWDDWDVVKAHTVPSEQVASGIITITTYRCKNHLAYHPV